MTRAIIEGDSLGQYILAIIVALIKNGVITQQQLDAAMLEAKGIRAERRFVTTLKTPEQTH